MNEINLSPVSIDQLTSSSVSNALPISGNQLGLSGSPTHNPIPAAGLPVTIPSLGTSLSSLPSALSLMLPMGIGDRGVMCGLPERNYPLPPPPYPHLESSYFRHILPGILSYLADRPPPQYIHPSSLNVDNSGLPMPNNHSGMDHYHPGATVNLETGIVSLDSRSVSHGSHSLHPSDGHQVQLDAGMGLQSVSRVASPISTDHMTEELMLDNVTADHQQVSTDSRTNQPLPVDSVGGSSMDSDVVGQHNVLPIQGGALELPVVLEQEHHHIASRVSSSDSTLNDSIHTVAMSTNSVSVALATTHPLSSMTLVSLHGGGISLEPVTVSPIPPEVSMEPGDLNVTSETLTFAPSSLKLEDSNSNKENMTNLFAVWCTLCDRAYPYDCPDHGPVTFIPDTPIQSRARLSLPKQLILRQSVTGGDVGVWTEESIPVRTCFGPLVGHESQGLDIQDWPDKAASHMWKIYHNNVLEFCVVTADENECNWMMFVRKARNPEEQNLVAYPHDGKIYFCTSRDVAPEQELLFYYSRDYARNIGVPEQPDVHVCLCGKECISYADFKSHLNSHVQSHEAGQAQNSGHGPGHPKERKWKCPMCQRAFSSPSKLNVHFMGHMGMKPFMCEFCSKAFSDPSNLRTHLRIHTGQKNFRCGMCDKSFTQKSHQTSHMVIHTKEKNMKCDFCDKMFMRRQDLKQHVLIHTRERQIKCPKCDRIFCRTSHLKKHLNSHEDKRDYICEKCSKAFLTKYHLTRHLNICKGHKSGHSSNDPEDVDGEDSEDEKLLGSADTEDLIQGNDVYASNNAVSEPE
ncbi:PR domain zinc finger protein 4 isoform X2 [Ambystoma mexicanum]